VPDPNRARARPAVDTVEARVLKRSRQPVVNEPIDCGRTVDGDVGKEPFHRVYTQEVLDLGAT